MEREGIIDWALAKMQMAEEYPLEKGYRYHHGLRTALVALSLAEGMNIAVNRDVLYIGGLLHDVGKAVCKGLGHGRAGAETIRAEIAGLFTAVELEAVCNIVANHYCRPNSKYYEGQVKPVFPIEVLLVQDADILDHFGANAIWLALHWAAAEGRTRQQSIKFYREQDAKWHAEARQGLNFPLSRRNLEERIAYSDAFFARLAEEAEGKLTCN